jgi:hypothetical protein
LIYVDTSFLAPFYINEATSEPVEAYLRSQPPEQLSINEWTQVEFASLVARRVRMGELNTDEVSLIFQAFEADCGRSYTVLKLNSSDFQTATLLLRQDQTTLRAGDALHLAIAQNQKAQAFLTLDRALIKSAQAIGLAASRGGVEP